jgi:hypothetical protein
LEERQHKYQISKAWHVLQIPAEKSLRKGRLANVVNARDQLIREAVLEQGYLTSQVAEFLSCDPSNVSRALQ